MLCITQDHAMILFKEFMAKAITGYRNKPSPNLGTSCSEAGIPEYKTLVLRCFIASHCGAENMELAA